ncbi:MAG: glycoside hydrolase family 172 protein [Bacteroidota bacterium]
MKAFRLFCVFSGLLAMMLAGCDPSTNRADLERLLSPASLPYTKAAKQYQVASTDSTGQNNDRITIAPGATATILNVTGPGIITRIWFTVDSRDPNFLRKLALKMYWDDETEPSVNVPFGDFFGCGFEYRPYISQYLGMTSGGYICYFPMPFEKSAKIQIINETTQEVYAFYYQINYFKLEGYLDRSVGYFHAYWNRDIRTDYDSNFTILRADGQGQVVGVNLQMQSYDGSFAFLEGNEMVYVDGEKKPSIVGTGTEDYFSSGWYFNQGEFAGPYHGLILKDDSLGRISAYRLNIVDPIPFKRHILFTIEHGHDNQAIADYSSTVYWYQLEDHFALPLLPKAGNRVPLKQITPNSLIEAEDLPLSFTGIPKEVVDVSELSPDWSGGKHLLIQTDSGSVITINLVKMFESEYRIDLYFSKGPDFGDVEIYHQQGVVGRVDGYAPSLQAGGRVTLHNIVPAYGKISLQLKVTGKNPASSGYLIGFDGVDMIPKRNYIPDWYILGPFPNPRITETKRLGLDSIYLPEINIDTNLRYGGAGGQPIRWRYLETPKNGYVSLWDKVDPYELVVTYAVTYIFSLKEVDVLLMIGSDDGAKVFFNNKEVYRYLGIRIAEPDQAVIPVHLRIGWNKLLLKIENNLGGYAFYARLLDPGNTLYYSAKQERPPPSWLVKK